MKGTVYKIAGLALAVLALTLVIVGLVTLGGKPVQVQAASASPAGLLAPQAQAPDNSKCLACHSKPDQVKKFPNGDMVSISVDENNYQHSVHSNIACQNCHTNITGFPHPANNAQSARDYTLQYKDTCKTCHADQAKAIEGSAHSTLAKEGNPNTPICADCHNPHTQQTIKKDTKGDPAPSENKNIANTCAKCHSAIVDEYKNSVHGAALFDNANTDVPACGDCHGIHTISNARSEEFRLNSPNLCATCHTRADIMNKYGISTNVMNTYVADFHGTTVTLFERRSPDLPSNKPVCYDCHGVHNIAAVNDPQRGLEIQKNLLTTCQKCHPDASQNFPTSWMSHYIATPQKFPLVYYVNLFYKIFIPTVLGGMGLFVLSDILFRWGIIGRKNRAGEVAAAHDTEKKE